LCINSSEILTESKESSVDELIYKAGVAVKGIVENGINRLIIDAENKYY
jgi:hypothetical protein